MRHALGDVAGTRLARLGKAVGGNLLNAGIVMPYSEYGTAEGYRAWKGPITVMTASTMLPPGTEAPQFTLSDACTPDFFVFGANRRLVYRGQMDDSRPGNQQPVTGADLRAALDAVLEGGPVPEEQKPSMGCNIKWKAGNEPDYF